MLELLAPAGSMESLRAAVQNGANAVYLGCGIYNARQGAKNFTPQALTEAVKYCHVRDVAVHLTLNTLVSDKETQELVQLIRHAAQSGVDAFIVQDLGVVRLCRQIAPHIPIHGSTQMTIHSLPGVLLCAAWGLSRVVLSRELSREEIRYICQNSPIEIEVFGHGALCMCYSGQCYLSAAIGGRSGNRGRCAQPCRQSYGYGRWQNQYPLSLKDSCLVEHLHELRSMGVRSIKLEGRMKRPEYVAVVTRIYRAVLDGRPVTGQDLQELETIFSRQGFTQGYYLGRTGPEMFGTHQDVPEDRDLMAAARTTYERGENPRVPVTFYAMIRSGEESQLAVEDPQGNVVRTRGPMPKAALNRPLTEDELRQRLSKTGGTPYYAAQVKAALEPGLMLPAAALNAMRREVLDQLTALRGRTEPPSPGTYAPLEPHPGRAEKPVLTVSVRTAAQITKTLLAAQPAVLYVPLTELLEHPELPGQLPPETALAAILPRVIPDRERSQWAVALERVRAMGVRQVLTGNLGQVRLAQQKGLEVRGDFGLNAFNSRTLDYLQRLGLRSQLLSFELMLSQIRDLQKPLDTELLVYGRLPLMLTENCIIKSRTGTCSCDTPTRLIDRMGEEFPILKDPGTCRSVLYNGKRLYLLDKLTTVEKIGLWAFRMSFTTENPAEVDAALAQYLGAGDFDPGTCTRGLYVRGVE